MHTVRRNDNFIFKARNLTSFVCAVLLYTWRKRELHLRLVAKNITVNRCVFSLFERLKHSSSRLYILHSCHNSATFTQSPTHLFGPAKDGGKSIKVNSYFIVEV